MLDFFTFTHFKKSPSLLHAVTTKSNDLPYTFSLALHTGEDADNIIANRKRLSSLLQSNELLHYIVADQTHSDNIKIITQKETKGWKSLSDAIEDCDALITDLKGVMLNILTADCVPILLYDEKKEVVAAVHAGWKGTKAQIASKTVQKMVETYGSDPKDIIAGVAPSIGRCCYEVGEEVAAHFSNMPEGFTPKGEKYMLDLPLINKQQLLDAGLQEKNIEMSHVCTACHVERFFSYRKEKGCSGRFMSMISMKNSKR
ncbi:peptidoglycan editing factor PgeF [Sulfurovum sp. XTW-4]|uniref:Purine nucleoside phosphorylase n=1 Tax=Sulfurovum xiamenensis TaxID=3019066 RepID=A0ABT7QTT8_9BACT|nr:peptidoglycan editing factor PgeF [Sulfurovum xiamenensis]MDM5264498.1 peptidoglycan editing factor PgeF [Sulfurovum xiamenensis]